METSFVIRSAKIIKSEGRGYTLMVQANSDIEELLEAPDEASVHSQLGSLGFLSNEIEDQLKLLLSGQPSRPIYQPRPAPDNRSETRPS